MSKIKLENLIYTVIYCILAVFLVNRITYSVVHYDEVFNIYVSYLTAICGQQHLVDNTYLFQTGDLFNLPFVYAFIKLTGSSEGIVLFLRFIFLIINAGLSVLFYFCFRDELGKRNSILFSLLIMIYSPFQMYSVYYDTASTVFLLAGAFLLVKAPKSKNPVLLRIFAGVCHACMAYAYPLMAITVLVFCIVIVVMEKEKRFKALLSYVAGAAGVFLIFVLYVLIFCGIKNLFIFKEGLVETGVSKRGIGAVAGGTDVTDNVWWHRIPGMLQLYDMVMEARSSVYELIPLFALIFIQTLLFFNWSKYFKKLENTKAGNILGKIRSFRWIIIPEIILPAWYNYRYQGGGFLFTRLYAHYYFYAPLLLLLLEDKKKSSFGKRLLAYLWLPGISGFLAVGYTAMFSNKAIMGLMPGAVATMIFMVLLMWECFNKRFVDKAIILFLATGHLVLFYMNDYENVKLKDADYKIASGIFKGIHGTKEDAFSEELYTFLDSYEGKKTYFSNSKDIRYIAGISTVFEEYDYKMKAVRSELEEGGSIEGIDISTLPSILIIDTEEADENDSEEYKAIYTLYNLDIEEYGHRIYTKK